MVPSAISAPRVGDRQILDQLLRLVEHARHVGEQQQALGLERAGDGAGEGVGVDVEGAAVRREVATGASTGISSRPITWLSTVRSTLSGSPTKPRSTTFSMLESGIDDGARHLARRAPCCRPCRTGRWPCRPRR